MTKKDTLIAGVKRVDGLIASAKSSGLSKKQFREASATIASAKMALRRERYLNARATKECGEQRRAIVAGLKDKTLNKVEAGNNMKQAISKVSKLKAEAKKIDAGLEALNNIKRELVKVSGESSTMYKEDKGHGSDAAIPAPQKAEPVGADATGGPAPMDPAKASDTDVKKDAEGKPQGEGTGDSLADGKVAKSARAKKMYLRAVAMIKAAATEKDADKKANLNKRAAVLEKFADNLLGVKAEKTASTTKKAKKTEKTEKTASKDGAKTTHKTAASQEKNAELSVFAAQDKVLMADGTVGIVSSVNEDKMTVSVAGVDKEVVSSTCKKIVSAPAPEKSSSIRDKIKSAINSVRAKKVTADEPQLAMEGEVEVIAEPAAPTAESPEESTVTKSEVKAIDFIEGEGYVVNKSETEVVSFGEDKAAAENYVQSMKHAAVRNRIRARLKDKKAGQSADPVIDSADHATPEGSEDINKKLKGLDQSGKDYGKTTKDEKVNPEHSMVGKASKEKTATSATPDSPVDSATVKKPDGTETIVQKIKGLTQQGKGYKTTTPDQKINPELSVYAKKAQVLEATTKKQSARLKELESGLLVDRAIKVGAVAEADRSEQQKILAELYETGPSEFKAYARLIDQLETNAGKEVKGNRMHRKIANSMENRSSVVVEGTVVGSSLEDENFFDD